MLAASGSFALRGGPPSSLGAEIAAGATGDEGRARSSRLGGFILLSVALHLLWFSLPLHRTPQAQATTAARPLDVFLSPRPNIAPAPVPTTSEPQRSQGRNSAVVERVVGPTQRPGSPTSQVTLPPAPAQATPPIIDLDAARASARAYAQEAPSRRALDAPRPPATVESAVAAAAAPDEVIEKRGANGAYVTESKHSRCITQLTVPHYMSGMAPPTLCEAR